MIQHHRRTEVTICRDIRRWNSDYSERERAPSAVTMTARSTSGSVSSLIILSSVSQTCCSAHQRHLQEFCVPTELKLSCNMLKTAWCSSLKTRAVLLLWPPASPFVMFQHLLVLFPSSPSASWLCCSSLPDRHQSAAVIFRRNHRNTTNTSCFMKVGIRVGGTGRVWLRGGVKQGDPTYIRLFADNLVLLVLLRLSWRWTRATCSQLGFTA